MNKKGDSTPIYYDIESAYDINFQHQVLLFYLSIPYKERATSNL